MKRNILFLLLFAISSCQKEGDLVEATAVTKATIALKVLSGDKYIVTIDDRPLKDQAGNDTLPVSGRIESAIIEKKSGKQHLVIREVTHNLIVVDSLIDLPAPSFTYLLLQLDPADRPILLSNNDNAPLPGTDSVKMRFMYADSNLPDSMKMLFYYIDGNTFEYELFDSGIVYRKSLGSYVIGNYKKYPGGVGWTLFGFDLIDAKTGIAIQTMDLDPSSPRFGQGILLETPTTGLGVWAKKQTILLEFGNNSVLSDVYKDRYLFGSDQ